MRTKLTLFLVLFIAFFMVSTFAEAQLVPPTLSATAVSSTQIDLTWVDPNNKESGVEVERLNSVTGQFELIATVVKQATTYSDTGLVSGTTYYYRIKPFFKNDFVYSNTASATTFNVSVPTIPDAPSNLNANAVSSSQINLSWTDNSTNEDGFKIERALSSSGPWSQIATVEANATTYPNTGLSPSTTYYYRINAYNSAGDSSYSNVANATTQSSITIPNAPSSLTASSVSSSQINLNWADNSTNEDGFKIERATSSTGPWSQIATVGANTTTYSNTGLSPSTTYYYRIMAYNSAGNSGYSNTASATTQADTTPTVPNAPSNLTATAVSSSQINLTWQDNSNNEEGFHVWRYHVSVGWSQIAIVGANITSYSDTGLSPSTTYYYVVRAYNSAGVSSWSNLPSATTLSGTGDTTPPTVSITSPASGTTYTSAQTVTINASASDNVGVTKVDFYDGGSYKGTDTTSPYTYAWSFTSADNGTHNWTAKAYDAAGNSSTAGVVSLTVNISTADTTPPTVSITSPPSGTTYTTAQTVTITATASDNVGVTKVEFYDASTLKGTDTTNAYTYSWTFTASDNGTHNWTAKAYDAAGNSSTSSVVSLTVNINTDTTPPTVSITSPASGTTYTSAQTVTITASASDNVGVMKVEFYDSTTLKGTDTTNIYTYSWTFTASDNSTHNWIAKAYDAAGNVTSSSTVSLTVNICIDTTPPATPAGLTATAVSSSQINLSWNPSYDTGCSGLAGYKVYRSVTQIGTTTATNYSDYGLTANTQYCYKVAAYDGAGNTSAQGSQACATTQPGSLPGGAHLWSDSFGSTGNDEGKGVAFDSVGNMIMTGYFNGTVDFGGGPLVANGSYADIFLAKYSSSGAHLWSKRFGGIYDDYGYAAAVDSGGNIIITGSFGGTIDFGGGPLTATGQDIFVAKFSSSGSLLWAKRFDASNPAAGYAVAVDINGNILLTGYFQGSIDFGGGPLVALGFCQDVFVAKLSPTGGHVWSKSFGGGLYDFGNGIAVDNAGDVVVVGQSIGSIDFGGGLLTALGGDDIFVVKYSATGSFLWAKLFGDGSHQEAYSVAVDGYNNILVTGQFFGTVDFGGGPMTSNGYSYSDIFLAKFTPSGDHVWAKRIGGSGPDSARGVAVDSSDNVLITGYFGGTVDFGGGSLTSTSMDIFVAKYSSSGGYLWAKRFGGSNSDIGNTIAVDNNGNALVSGYFQNTIDFGGGPQTSAGALDIFLLKLAP